MKIFSLAKSVVGLALKVRGTSNLRPLYSPVIILMFFLLFIYVGLCVGFLKAYVLHFVHGQCKGNFFAHNKPLTLEHAVLFKMMNLE